MTDAYVISPPRRPDVAVEGESRRFPVHRIYCVGRNYAEHAREMGMKVGREAPFFFSKPPDAVVPSGTEVPMPPRSMNVHHEIELVVAIGRGGRNIAAVDARDHIYGYAVGNDLTRRDLQAAAKDRGQPWDTAKGFDCSAPISAIRPAANIGHLVRGRIWLSVNGTLRQEADIDDMLCKVPELIAELSTYFTLLPGDLLFTGTPAGVGRLVTGDLVEGGVEGVAALTHRMV
jgi:fumarylpyruvate hydrolase